MIFDLSKLTCINAIVDLQDYKCSILSDCLANELECWFVMH